MVSHFQSHAWRNSPFTTVPKTTKGKGKAVKLGSDRGLDGEDEDKADDEDDNDEEEDMRSTSK